MNDQTPIGVQSADTVLRARAEAAKANAVTLVGQCELTQGRARAGVASCLAIRDRIADVLWALDMATRNPALSEHLNRTRRRYAAVLGRAPEIEQAARIVSDRYGCSPTESFSLMRNVSQRTNRKLAVVAGSIVEQHDAAHPAEKDAG